MGQNVEFDHIMGETPSNKKLTVLGGFSEISPDLPSSPFSTDILEVVLATDRKAFINRVNFSGLVPQGKPIEVANFGQSCGPVRISTPHYAGGTNTDASHPESSATLRASAERQPWP